MRRSFSILAMAITFIVFSEYAIAQAVRPHTLPHWLPQIIASVPFLAFIVIAIANKLTPMILDGCLMFGGARLWTSDSARTTGTAEITTPFAKRTATGTVAILMVVLGALIIIVSLILEFYKYESMRLQIYDG